MLKVGITGGIGSGKTTVCKIFEKMGIPIYYADDRAKALMVENQALINNLIALFGEQAYLENGQLNRAHIANIVFNDQAKLKELNALVHPAVHQDANDWAAEQAKKNVPYALREAALIFEGGGNHYLDKVITVFADKEVRLARVIARDKSTREAVEARMNKQMPEEEKIKLADFVIYNNGDQSLEEQVRKIHDSLIESGK